MTELLSLLATGVLAALGFWLLGGVLLRVGGILLVAVGLLSTATTGSPSAALLTLLGAVAWLGGQWLFAVRHHYFGSPLARRVFHEALPRQLDPTRGWGIPNVPSEGRQIIRGVVVSRANRKGTSAAVERSQHLRSYLKPCSGNARWRPRAFFGSKAQLWVGFGKRLK